HPTSSWLIHILYSTQSVSRFYSFSFFFFFSSRRRHTRWPRDWSSDVCSSDLTGRGAAAHAPRREARRGGRGRDEARRARTRPESGDLPPRGQVAHNRPTLAQGDAVNGKRNDWSRREFVSTSAAAAGASLAAQTIGPIPQRFLTRPPPGPASDRVRFGMVGIGMQGSGLLGNAITLPGVECAAAADLYDG